MWLSLKTKFALLMGAIGVDWVRMPDGDKLQVAVGTVVGVVVGGLGIIIGYYSYQVSKRQGVIAEQSYDISKRQGELAEQAYATSKRQEELAQLGYETAKRQGELAELAYQISKRQTQIAEKQDQYLQDQMRRAAKLELRLFMTLEDDYKFYLAVTNTGNKVAKDFYWQLLKTVGDPTQLEGYYGPLNKEEDLTPYDSDRYRMTGGYVTTPLYPGRSLICAILRVPKDYREAWRGEDRVGLYPYLVAVTSEDGRVPVKDWTAIPLEPKNAWHPIYKAHLFQ